MDPALNQHINAARKLRPVIQSVSALLALADQLEDFDRKLSVARAQLAEVETARAAAEAAAHAARVAADEVRTAAAEEAKATVAAGKAAAGIVQNDAARYLAEAEAKAGALVADAVNKRRELEALNAKLANTATELTEGLRAKRTEAVALDKRIADARATLRRFAEGQL
jgi:cell division septum initiation protein DivIVA